MNDWQVTATKRQERKREWREEMRREKGIDTMRHIYESDERLLWRNGNRRGGLPESLFVHFLYWLVLGTVYGFRSLSLSLSLAGICPILSFFTPSFPVSASHPLSSHVPPDNLCLGHLPNPKFNLQHDSKFFHYDHPLLLSLSHLLIIIAPPFH